MKLVVFILLLALTHCATTEKKEEPPAQPTVDREGIRQTINSHARYIRECYGKSLVEKGNEQIKGKMVVYFAIDPNGKAHSPKVINEKSTLTNALLSQCLMDGLVSWEFPAPTNGTEVTVHYPFVFSDKPPANMQQRMDKFEKMKRNE